MLSKSNRFLFQNYQQIKNTGNYKKLNYGNTYKHENKWLPTWISSEPEFLGPMNGIWAFKMNPTNSIQLCNILSVDGVLNIEVQYKYDHNWFLLWLKPNWWATCEVNCELYNKNGELIWNFRFGIDSPLKEDSDSAFNIYIFSHCEISADKMIGLTKSVIVASTVKLVEALNGDIKS